jgi:5-formyltetrahydrofolate cyclo-ligase
VNLRKEKRALRDALLAMRNRLDPEMRAHASQAIATGIESLDDYRRAGVVLLTLPFRSEWNASLTAARAIATGKIVAAPRVDPAARMLRPLRIVDLGRDIEAGYQGIPEPRATCPPVALEAFDWVLVPGVAFDTAGHRLGYGGGYYDRLLPLLPGSARRIAGAFEAQLIDRVPAAPHDVGVDCIVTEQRIIQCARPAA